MDKDDDVVGMEIPTQGNFIVTVSEKGVGQRAAVEEYPVQGRGGKGVINLRQAKGGNITGILQVAGDEDMVLISDSGKIIRLKVGDIRTSHRSTQGVILIDLEPTERLVSLARAEKESEERYDNQEPEDDMGDEMPEPPDDGQTDLDL
jgi:DNA gyrase subunit A